MAKIPRFNNEQEDMEFWDTHDSTDFFEDTEEINLRFVGPRPRKTLISLRFDQETIDGLKVLATMQGLGYQTLLRTWVTERLMSESGFVQAQPYSQTDVANMSNAAVISADATARTRLLVEQAVSMFPRLVSDYQQLLDNLASNSINFHPVTMSIHHET